MKLVEVIRGLTQAMILCGVSALAGRWASPVSAGYARLHREPDLDAMINEAVVTLYHGIGSVEDVTSDETARISLWVP